MAKRKFIKWGIVAVTSPIIIIILLTASLYLPWVQNWAVRIASESASESLGMEISIERVRLAFPLDLCVEEVKAVKQNDSLPQRKDVIAHVKRAVLDVQLLPLLHSNVCVDAVEIIGMRLNTMDFIPQARIKGEVGRLALGDGTPVATVSLARYEVLLKKALLDNAHLDIALTDSVPEDTASTENLWKIQVGELSVTNSDLLLHMPGDTLQVGISLGRLTAQGGDFHLHKGQYNLTQCRIANSCVRYDNKYMHYIPDGMLDANHIALHDVNMRIDSLHFLAPDMTMKIASMSMKEKSGLAISSMTADIALDSTQIRFNGMLKTPSSFIGARVAMDMNAFDTIPSKGKVKASIDASISRQDLMLSAAGALPASLRKSWPERPLIIKGEAIGNMEDVLIPSLSIEMPTVFAVDASGKAKGFMELADNPYSKDFSATLHADMKTQDISAFSPFIPSPVNIPATHATLDIDAKGADYGITLDATEGKGHLAAKAKANIAAMAYTADIKAKNLHLGHFVKGMQLGMFTGNGAFSGQGTDILSNKTWVKATGNIERFDYAKYNLDNIKADILLKNGRANANIDAHNALIDGKICFDALMSAKKLDATLMTELYNADLYNLHIVDQPLKVAACTHVDIRSDFKENNLVLGTLSDIAITDSANTYRPDDIALDIKTTRDTTIANVDCGDFTLRLNAQGGYKRLGKSAGKLPDIMKQQFENRTIDQTELRRALPNMSLTLHSSKENPIYRFIKYYDVDYDEVDAMVKTSFEEGVTADILMKGLSTQGYQLDTISLKVNSSNDPYKIAYKGYVRNVKPNDYVFTVEYDGEVMEHGISLNTIFRDANDETGLRFGVEATMVEEGLNFHFLRNQPIIAYEKFRFKKDNYILLDRRNRVFADIDLQADNGTGIQLYSTSSEENAEYQQDITLSVTNMNIGRLLSTIPYAPKTEGTLDGDLHFVQEADQSFSISSSINTRNLVYENCPIGNLGTELVYMPNTDGAHYIDGTMSLDGNEIGTIKGSYNFDTSDINADMAFYKFPMQIANGFIPDQIIGLEGYAEGLLAIHGTTQSPQVNGELFLESASLISVPYGTKMRFDDDPIRIVDSKLLFENFQMYANNNQPLTSYGSLDFSDPSHMKLDLLMKAENFLLIDSKETKRSEAYGKAYVNFLASMKGELDKLKVRGKIDVLPTTNIFYILRDSPLSNDNRMKELVKFTDLHSGEATETIRPSVDGLDISMNINVKNGSHVKCWLNDARTNYLDIIGEGDLRWRYLNDEMSMTGRYTISEGEIKYSLPVIPLKTFVISNGSYIEFAGDIMNPKLNITAKETKKASANVNGTNRMVTFNTGVVLTKTLNDMGLEFIIEAPEDNAVTDELNMKSKEERGKLAVTMLTTGMYLSDGNTSSFSMNSALNSFLQSEISSIAGSALKTLDLSFGMDNSTEEDGTIHTDYSFKFAKRFWNNRLSISVGGKISTGPDVSGQNKSFFDNVEMQYRLSDVSNKYMNLFYNRSVYDFLEGYVGQYGGGFLWKKKIQNLREIFKSTPQTPPAQRMSVPKEKADSVKNTH